MTPDTHGPLGMSLGCHWALKLSRLAVSLFLLALSSLSAKVSSTRSLTFPPKRTSTAPGFTILGGDHVDSLREEKRPDHYYSFFSRPSSAMTVKFTGLPEFLANMFLFGHIRVHCQSDIDAARSPRQGRYRHGIKITYPSLPFMTTIDLFTEKSLPKW